MASGLEWWAALRLAVGADVGREWAVSEHDLQSPRFGRCGGDAPRRWPPKAKRQQVALSPNNRNAEAGGSERLRLAVNQRAVRVPGGNSQPQVGIVRRSEPLENTNLGNAMNKDK